MIINMLSGALNILFYIYLFFKLETNYNQYYLHTFMVYTTYYTHGFTFAMYTCCVSLLMMYYNSIPTIIKMIRNNYIKPKYLTDIKQFNVKYNLPTIKKYILVIGDVCVNVFLTILSEITKKIISIQDKNMLKKFNKIKNKKCDDVDKIDCIDEYLNETETNDEDDEMDVEKINEQLNNLLMMGSNIIEQVRNGNKENQKDNAKLFMSNFDKLLKNS